MSIYAMLRSLRSDQAISITNNMSTNKTGSRLALSLCLIAGLLVSACAELRILTYPVDFTWIGKEHLKTAMHGMANSVSNINSALTTDIEPDSQQDLILEELDNIDLYAQSLSGETEWSSSDRNRLKSNHPLLADNLDRFIEIVGKARLQAQSVPANYYGVGKITGGCSSCHRLR